ncbi:hypothetical protein [Marinitoga litoralis]|jgi:hypothetical protein|uniref:hypothetical protein n=1 Tax=Marinitoga litoralis TaxID=570855 RepID=UPI001960A954|nr:hypothetical protein [Marinitoga litoralis]MBM7558937.1 tetratricopeptide (TPR) repeat protein [Marinitoga litoralis]
MKRILILIYLIFVFLQIFSVDIGEFYATYFDVDKMINSNDINIKIFGYFKKYLESGYSSYLKAANELRVEYDNNLTFKEKKLFDILSSINPQTTLSPINRLNEFKNTYPDLLITDLLLIEFEYNQWKITGDPNLGAKVINNINKLERVLLKSPFLIYYKSNFMFNSNLYGNKNDAYMIIKEGVLNFPDNKKIIETYITISTSLKKNFEDDEIFEKISKTYIKEPEGDEKILLFIAKHFFEKNDKDFAYNIVNKKILPNTKNYKILFLVYELLGDYSDTYTQKMNYYKKALEYDSDNSRVLSKWALAMLNVDYNKYKSLARIALNKAVTLDPNLSEEALNALKKLRNEIKIDVMFNYILPILFFVAISIFIIIYFEKRKKQKEKELMFKEGDENDRN